jgi:hypothetical protein
VKVNDKIEDLIHKSNSKRNITSNPMFMANPTQKAKMFGPFSQPVGPSSFIYPKQNLYGSAEVLTRRKYRVWGRGGSN